jgi:hypothetical protein
MGFKNLQDDTMEDDQTQLKFTVHLYEGQCNFWTLKLLLIIPGQLRAIEIGTLELALKMTGRYSFEWPIDSEAEGLDDFQCMTNGKIGTDEE